MSRTAAELPRIGYAEPRNHAEVEGGGKWSRRDGRSAPKKGRSGDRPFVRKSVEWSGGSALAAVVALLPAVVHAVHETGLATAGLGALLLRRSRVDRDALAGGDGEQHAGEHHDEAENAHQGLLEVDTDHEHGDAH